MIAVNRSLPSRSNSSIHVRWKQLSVKIVVWLAAKVLLNCLGLDDLADCSEFVINLGKGEFRRRNSPVALLLHLE